MTLVTAAKKERALKKAFEKALNTPKQPTAPTTKDPKEARKHAKGMLGGHSAKEFRAIQKASKEFVAAGVSAKRALYKMTEHEKKPNTRRTASERSNYMNQLEAVIDDGIHYTASRGGLDGIGGGIAAVACPKFAVAFAAAHEAVRGGRP
jgi:hypothetical protein